MPAKGVDTENRGWGTEQGEKECDPAQHGGGEGVREEVDEGGGEGSPQLTRGRAFEAPIVAVEPATRATADLLGGTKPRRLSPGPGPWRADAGSINGMERQTRPPTDILSNGRSERTSEVGPAARTLPVHMAS